MVADIECKTEGLYWTEKCLTWEAYIDTEIRDALKR
jgi:hypothetical protein